MKNYNHRIGNIYFFDELDTLEDAILDFGKPIKRVKLLNKVVISDDDNTTGLDVEKGFTYRIANRYGYPDHLKITNNDTDSIVPIVIVEEYGDSINEEYYIIDSREESV